MDDFTIISYPGAEDLSLLSLTESRSRYMLPIGGKFRVIDFTLRNSFAVGAKKTIIFTGYKDGLEEYVSRYGPWGHIDFAPVRIISDQFSEITAFQNLIENTDTKYCIIYNGDHPSIIDFSEIVKRYRKRKTDSLLFRLSINGKPTMAHKLLITKKSALIKTIKNAINEKRSSPNIFEMIINMMINKGIKTGNYTALYWPVKNIPEYFNLNREIIWNPEIFSLLYRDQIIKSQIKGTGYAKIGFNAKIKNSFISDYCTINGTVENSIIYPGVEIGDDSVIRDSIILPYVRIGSGARLTRTIVDERTDPVSDITFDSHSEMVIEDDPLNIEDMCTIGTDQDQFKNSDFPKSLFSSITLIGKNARILRGANIGGACFVPSEKGEDYFRDRKYLHDGMSVAG